jgi:predicted RNA binding protein YcfA (HicA-like mRNA interferase family)
VKYRELTRKLEQLNCSFHRQGKGDHEIWSNRANGNKTVIPNWGHKELKPGTVRAILRQLGIDPNDFNAI